MHKFTIQGVSLKLASFWMKLEGTCIMTALCSCVSCKGLAAACWAGGGGGGGCLELRMWLLLGDQAMREDFKQ